MDECDSVLHIKLHLCVLHGWVPHEIMVLKNGKELDNDDPAPETASVLWKESEESNLDVWINDLELLAHFGDKAGASRCASKVLRINARRANYELVTNSPRGEVGIVEAYISAGMDQKSLGEALLRSSHCGQLRIVNALLSANASVNYTFDGSDERYCVGGTPLHQSCLVGYIDVVKALIAAHADVNARDCDNRTPLTQLEDQRALCPS